MTRKRDTELERMSFLMATCTKVSMWLESAKEPEHIHGKVNRWSAFAISNQRGELYTAGYRYQGEFQNNLRHGNGLFIYPDGSKYNGTIYQRSCVIG